MPIVNNAILKLQTEWRYCRVKAGEKAPYPAGWQNTPLTLEQVDSDNIGLMLGPASGGICAIDFDGPSAWTWAEEQAIDISSLTSVAWTSGKDSRCQIAYWVPEPFWKFLKTKKIPTKPASAPGAGDSEGFEFRWTGGQSVLPPSIHPGTQQPYYWLVDATNKVERIPDDILAAWCQQSVGYSVAISTEPEVQLDDLTEEKVTEVNILLEAIKGRYPALSYDDWFKVASATAHHIGRAPAEIVLKQYYPERRPNEYKELLRSWNPGRSPKIGTLRHMAGLSKPEPRTNNNKF